MTDSLLQFSLVLFAAALTAWFAIITYFRQREHELILTRYLEGSLDLLAAETERVSETFGHNWARCLAILKSYRDLEDQFDVDELSKGFLELQSSKLNIVAHHRLYTLIGSGDYWQFYQKAMTYYTTANSVVVKEIPEAIRARLTSDRYDTPHAELAKHGLDVAKEQDENSNNFLQLVAELQLLSGELECERYRFKDLYKFRNKKEVQDSLQRVKDLLTILEKDTEGQQEPLGDAKKRHA